MGLLDQVLRSVLGGGRDGGGQSSALMPALMALLGGGARSGGGLSGLLGGAMGDGRDGGTQGGLGGLIDRFGRSGHGDIMSSWISTGENRPIAPDQLRQALGDDTVSHLQRQTGLERNDLLSQLSRLLPSAVDRLTPDGRVPDELHR